MDFWPLGANETWFIAMTNYDRDDDPSLIDDRITPINDCMNKIGQKVIFKVFFKLNLIINYLKNVSFENLFDVLSTQPVLNKVNFVLY